MFLQLGPMEDILVSISQARGLHCIQQQHCGTLKILTGAWDLVLHQSKLLSLRFDRNVNTTLL